MASDEEELTREELNELHAKRRKKTLRQTVEDLKVVLANDDGFRRLLAITDEEWAAAVAKDGGPGGPA